jgi:hypothetical protein
MNGMVKAIKPFMSMMLKKSINRFSLWVSVLETPQGGYFG